VSKSPSARPLKKQSPTFQSSFVVRFSDAKAVIELADSTSPVSQEKQSPWRITMTSLPSLSLEKPTRVVHSTPLSGV